MRAGGADGLGGSSNFRRSRRGQVRGAGKATKGRTDAGGEAGAGERAWKRTDVDDTIRTLSELHIDNTDDSAEYSLDTSSLLAAANSTAGVSSSDAKFSSIKIPPELQPSVLFPRLFTESSHVLPRKQADDLGSALGDAMFHAGKDSGEGDRAGADTDAHNLLFCRRTGR